MLDNIGLVARGAVQHSHAHRGSLSHGSFCSAQTPILHSSSTALKHLLEDVRHPIALQRLHHKLCSGHLRHAASSLDTCPWSLRPDKARSWCAVAFPASLPSPVVLYGKLATMSTYSRTRSMSIRPPQPAPCRQVPTKAPSANARRRAALLWFV